MLDPNSKARGLRKHTVYYYIATVGTLNCMTVFYSWLRGDDLSQIHTELGQWLDVGQYLSLLAMLST